MPILTQEHISYERRLQYLDFLLPTVRALRERFIRQCNAPLTPSKVYQNEIDISGDESKAQLGQAWSILNQTSNQMG